MQNSPRPLHALQLNSSQLVFPLTVVIAIMLLLLLLRRAVFTALKLIITAAATRNVRLRWLKKLPASIIIITTAQRTLVNPSWDHRGKQGVGEDEWPKWREEGLGRRDAEAAGRWDSLNSCVRTGPRVYLWEVE
jgi:hypothetical protein